MNDAVTGCPVASEMLMAARSSTSTLARFSLAARMARRTEGMAVRAIAPVTAAGGATPDTVTANTAVLNAAVFHPVGLSGVRATSGHSSGALVSTAARTFAALVLPESNCTTMDSDAGEGRARNTPSRASSQEARRPRASSFTPVTRRRARPESECTTSCESSSGSGRCMAKM